MTEASTIGLLPPVRRSVLVQSSADQCWVALTERIGQWWPMVGHSCTEDPLSALAFVEGDLVETGVDGRRYVWGTVLRWEPPTGLVLSWHPGRPAGPGPDAPGVSEVEWRLTELDPGATLVEVVHRGWERLEDSVGRRTEYGNGWPSVLEAFAGSLADDEQPSMWHILTHTPGPAADPGVAVQAQDAFAGHERFLAALGAEGLLVAAGPLPGGAATGQTVVRGLTTEQAIRRAEGDDAVRGGLLQVTVQPWVVLTRG